MVEPYDAHHEKTDLKVFVVVIPRPSFFWYDTDFLEFEVCFLVTRVI